MNTRKVCDVVASIKQQLGLLQNDSNPKHILVHVEEKLIKKRLLAKLNALQNCQETATKGSLSALFFTLGEHRNYTKNTHLDPTLATNAAINKFCYAIASVLGKELNIPVYEILLPDVNLNYVTSKGKLSDLKLHEFVFDDEGNVPLEIRAVLDDFNPFTTTNPELQKQRIKRINSYDYQLYSPHTGKPLSDAEQKRVRKLYVQAKEYYLAIVCNRKLKPDDDLLEKQRIFYDALDNNKLELNGEDQQLLTRQGLARLATNLMKNILTQEQLVDFIQELTPKERKAFLLAINTEDLSRIMLKGNEWDKVMPPDKTNFKEACEEYNSLIGVCYYILYLKIRTMEGVHNTWGTFFSTYTAGYIGAHSEESKKNAVYYACDVLGSGQVPLAKFKDYVANDEKGKQHYNALFSERCGGISHALVKAGTKELFKEPANVTSPRKGWLY